MKKGMILVLTGASSVGKNLIRDEIMKDEDMNLFYSISVTTRPKKEDEIDGKDYYFVSYETFASAVRNRELLEYTEFGGYYYGTPCQQVDFLINQGKNVLIEVEAQGVGQIKLKHPDALCVFVIPENMEELEKQIRLRYKDDETTIQQRLNKAQMEMELQPLFNNVVTNTDAEASAAAIKKAFMNERKKG